MSYQIGTQNCLNMGIPGVVDPNWASCPYVGKVWYFAADSGGRRISNFFDTPDEVNQAMNALPSFTAESLQLEKKANYLQNSDVTWSNQEAYNSELSETQNEINTFNSELKNQTVTTPVKEKKFNVWYIVLPIVILILFLLKRGGK